MRIPSGEPDLVDDWDPQGLNSLAKDELESFSSDDEDVEVVIKDEIVVEETEEEEQDVYSADLDRDGLTELEEMEMSLLAEESPLDFAMVGEEE
jgi:hypothetical protein